MHGERALILLGLGSGSGTSCRAGFNPAPASPGLCRPPGAPRVPDRRVPHACGRRSPFRDGVMSPHTDKHTPALFWDFHCLMAPSAFREFRSAGVDSG